MAAAHPGLRIAGTHDGYFKEDGPVVAAIRQSGADVVFVCLGAPKQEKWMAKNGAATGARLLCGLGGSLDVFAGVVERAPKFWTDHGLEWFYRLCRAPPHRPDDEAAAVLIHVKQEKNTDERKTDCIRGHGRLRQGTQPKLLCETLAQRGIAYREIDFPRYGNPFAEPANLYLHGAWAAGGDVNAYAASVLYAVDASPLRRLGRVL
ncbi:MAG: WecB/TagA/CpsF family glycosyltransferase [Dysosmobacter welbionis]